MRLYVFIIEKAIYKRMNIDENYFKMILFLIYFNLYKIILKKLRFILPKWVSSYCKKPCYKFDCLIKISCLTLQNIQI